MPTPTPGDRCRRVRWKSVSSVDNAASAGSSVVEVRAEDDAGLLHRITAALFALDLDVVAARVSTFGHEVVDAFYVRDTATGGKVTDPVQIEAGARRRGACHQHEDNASGTADVRESRTNAEKMPASDGVDPLSTGTIASERMPCRKPHTDAGRATPGII